jgi:hypothetical protein
LDYKKIGNVEIQKWICAKYKLALILLSGFFGVGRLMKKAIKDSFFRFNFGLPANFDEK